MNLLENFLRQTELDSSEARFYEHRNSNTLDTAIAYFRSVKDNPMCKEMTPLMAAIDVGYLELVKRLIDDGADVNEGSINGLGPLSWALQKKRDEIASLLIKSGADVNLPNINGYTPMYYAIDKVLPVSIVQDLIDHGVAVDGPLENKEDGIVPITKAIEKNNIPVVKLLLERSVPALVPHNSTTTLGKELRKDKKGTLVYHGTKVSALTMAVKNNSIESLKLLIDCGFEIDGYDDEYMIPLHASVLNDDLRFMRALINAGADVNKVHNMSKVVSETVNPYLTALQFATLLLRYEAVKELLSAGADANKATPAAKQTPLHLVCEFMSGKNVECKQNIVDILIEYGADMYLRDSNNFSPGLYCVLTQNFDLAEELLCTGLDVNADNGELGSLLLYSTISGDPKFVKLCLEHGGDSRRRGNNDDSVYEEAIKSGPDTVKAFFPYHPVDEVRLSGHHRPLSLGHLQMLKTQYLYFNGIKRNKTSMVMTALQHGAEPKAFLTDMRFPIFRPVASKNHAILRMLLNRGVCPNVQNKKGETPLHVAARIGFTKGCCDLLKHGACYDVKSTAGQSPSEIAVEAEVIKLLKGIHLLFQKAKKDDVILIKSIFKQMPDAVLFSSINCVNRRGNTLMQEAIVCGASQVAQAIMAVRLSREH